MSGDTTEKPMETTLMGREQSIQITDAILLYGNRAATLHKVSLDQGVPTILPGQPVTPDHLRQIISGLAEMETPPQTPQKPQKNEKKQKSLDLGILPQNVLFADVGSLIFWVPAGRRPLYFQDKLKRFNNKKVRHPALIFKIDVGEGVSVFALRSSKRPDASTRLYQAPYFNVYDSGHVCHGSAPFPSTPHPRFIQQCLDAFFMTKFTHQSTRKKLVKNGTYLQYMQAMKQGKDPRPWLVDVHLNLGDYISGKTPREDE